ncbi:MAG: MBL fold metallo-hydrolase [Deltaproteobacteria bacterium]|nr:MBL fold metallo-hydrolase [Deltaproteobacteria bacterium]
MAIDRPPPGAAPLLRFLGAAGTVTGSRFLIETPAARVLVDCGLFQGLKPLRLRNWQPFPVAADSIDAVLLTHAHVDHSGYLPALVRQGFRGPIFATAHSEALCRIVLPDSGHLQEEDAAHANRAGYSKHHPALPLYTQADAERALGLFRTVAWDTPVDVAPGLRARLRPAGHILGAASVTVELDGARPRSVTVSGDLGRPSHPLLCAPAPPPASDVLLVESTYGDRRHEDAASMQAFEDALRRTAARGGMTVIPSFAVDRTEVVLFHLRRLMRAGRVPAMPVYVDSPMALAALDVYRAALAAGGPDLAAHPAGDGDPFDPGDLRAAHTPQESEAINAERGPAVIVSASGMAVGGRVLHHLRHRLPNARNTLLLPGFQAEGTRGRALLDGATEVKLLGRYVPVRAEVVSVPAFSVHADQGELVDWVAAAPRPPEMIYVVHGEPQAANALRAAIEQRLAWPAVVPRFLETVRLD